MRALLVVSLAGCSLSSLVREQAASDFSCPEKQIVLREVSPGGVEARGCGRQAIYKGPISSPIERASFDLSCPPAQLTMVDIGDYAVGVEGCGKRASYAWVESAWVGGLAR
jgi:hypothetical protein